MSTVSLKQPLSAKLLHDSPTIRIGALTSRNHPKAVGLAHMISTMRPNSIDHANEYVRNTTACAFSVVTSALGIPSLLPFLQGRNLTLKFSLSLLVGSYLTSTANNDGQQLQQHETRMMARDDKEHNNDDESPPASNVGGFFSFCYYLAVLIT